ncbi:hypothetical protein ACLB2K_026250 [Fragaria x ananassa]
MEDMLRSCAMQFRGSWDKNLSLIEFAYNNSFHSSIGMAPFEALYGRQCRTLLCWNEVGEKEFCGPEIIQDTNEKIKVIRNRLKAAQNRQKSYADNRRNDVEFQVGDWVFLKLSPWKGVIRFGKRGKLTPRYIGPYKIIEQVGTVAYRLELPLELSRIHNVFHVSMLRKYITDPSHVLQEQPISLKKDLTCEGESSKSGMHKYFLMEIMGEHRFDFIAPFLLSFIFVHSLQRFKCFSPRPFVFKCPVCRVRFGEDRRRVIDSHLIRFSHIGY